MSQHIDVNVVQLSFAKTKDIGNVKLMHRRIAGGSIVGVTHKSISRIHFRHLTTQKRHQSRSTGWKNESLRSQGRLMINVKIIYARAFF